MTTGAAFLGEKCFVWQWRLVDLSYFAYHKCIHLNVDVEWSIWNTFEIAGIFCEGFLLLATLVDPLVCFHPSTGPPQHQWRDPHPGPSKASLQRRWQIIPSVASGVLSRKKRLVPKRRVFSRCFRSICFTQAIFQRILPWRYFKNRLKTFGTQVFSFHLALSYVNPFVQKPLKCMGHVCFEFLDDEFGGRLFFVVVFQWKGWVKTQMPRWLWLFGVTKEILCHGSIQIITIPVWWNVLYIHGWWLRLVVFQTGVFHSLGFVSMVHDSGK